METNRKKKQTTENFIKVVRRKTRRVFSSEQKIQIVMEAMRAEMSVQKSAESTQLQMHNSTSGTKSFWRQERSV